MNSDYQIEEVEAWSVDDDGYVYFIKKRVYYFFGLFRSNKFRYLMNSFGDAPVTFYTKQEAENYVEHL